MQTNVPGSNGYGTFAVDASGKWTYTTNSAHNEFVGGQNYTDSFTVTTADGTPKVVTATITGTNDAPLAPPQTVFATEGGAAVTANAMFGATDADSTTLTVVNLPVSLPAGVSYNSGTQVFTLNPGTAAYNELAKDELLPVTANYSVSDGTISTPTSVTFNITGTNDAPLLTADPVVDLDTTLPDAGRSVVGQLSTYDVDHFATQSYSFGGTTTWTNSTLLSGYNLASTGTFGTLYLNSADGNYSFVYNPAVDALFTRRGERQLR